MRQRLAYKPIQSLLDLLHSGKSYLNDMMFTSVTMSVAFSSRNSPSCVCSRQLPAVSASFPASFCSVQPPASAPPKDPSEPWPHSPPLVSGRNFLHLPWSGWSSGGPRCLSAGPGTGRSGCICHIARTCRNLYAGPAARERQRKRDLFDYFRWILLDFCTFQFKQLVFNKIKKSIIF